MLIKKLIKKILFQFSFLSLIHLFSSMESAMLEVVVVVVVGVEFVVVVGVEFVVKDVEVVVVNVVVVVGVEFVVKDVEVVVVNVEVFFVNYG